MNDVLGTALWDHYHQSSPQKLWIHNTYGRKEEMPVEIYFRSWKNLPLLEKKALGACTGNILDAGAGAGSHSLILQLKGRQVTALDISPKAVALMKERGVLDTVCANIFEYREQKFDTVLLLMNGIGLAGSLAGLRRLLQHSKLLLKRGGQLIFDSSDVAYLYKGRRLPTERYYGEINFRYEYKKRKTDWFSWLYVDQNTLALLAEEEGWKSEVWYKDRYGQYLARLSIK